MAERMIRVCDKCEGSDAERSPAVDSMTFEYDSHAYRVDVCEVHAAELKDLVETLAAWASVSTTLSRRGTQHHRATTTGTMPADYTSIRAWAKENGIEVAPKGRIADKIVRAYKDAFPTKP